MRIKSLIFLGMGTMFLVLSIGNSAIAESQDHKDHTGHDFVESTKTADLINWRTLAAGKKEASEKNMPILVDFYTKMPCERCRTLDKKVYCDSHLTESITGKFVPVRVDLDKQLTIEEQILMNNLETGGECILAFLDSQGEIIRDQDGKKVSTMEMLSSDKYMWYMEQSLKHMKK